MESLKSLVSVARRVLQCLREEIQVKVQGNDANANVKKTLKRLRKFKIFREEGD